MGYSVIIGAFIAVLGGAATASSPDTQVAATDAGPACPDVLDYATWKEAPEQAWNYRSAQVTIIGASHSRDPEHEQFARIATSFAEARPTVVFFEGPDRGFKDSAEETIKATGESGYVRHLAAQAGIPARSLEPSPPERLRALIDEFPLDQALLFFVVREAVRMRDREGVTGDALEAAVARMLPRLQPLAAEAGVKLPFSDTAGLQSTFSLYWPGRDWKAAEAHWFQPGGDDRRTGGVFAAAINRADSTNRNRHLVKLLSEAVASGERPFVVIGRNHVPMVAPSLDCRLKEEPTLG